MDAYQYEEAERFRSEEAARNFLLREFPDEDERILLSKASDVLDEQYPWWVPERKGLERFSLLLLQDDSLAGFVEKVRLGVFEFEGRLLDRDTTGFEMRP